MTNPTVWLTLSEDLAFFAAENEFAQHIVHCIENITQVAPSAGQSLFDDIDPRPSEVYILPVKTAAALDKIVQAPPAPMVLVLGSYALLKPYQFKAPAHVGIYDEARAKTRLPRAFAVLHALKRDAFCVALRALPALRDAFDLTNTAPTADDVRHALLPDEALQVYPTPLRAGLMSGDDYGTLCFETEKTWSTYQKNPSDGALLTRAQRLNNAKIRCKQGLDRAFVV